MGAFDEIVKGAKSLAEGMGITIKHMVSTPVTVEYPHELAPISKAQRNAIRLIDRDEVGGESHNCIACLQCEKICPSQCISITGYRPDGLVMKRPEKFDMNFALCSECGLCIDVCPTETLGYTKTYDAVSYHREFVHDLLKDYRATEDKALEVLREIDRKKKEEREAKRKADAEAKAKADAEAKAKAAAEPKADAAPPAPAPEKPAQEKPATEAPKPAAPEA